MKSKLFIFLAIISLFFACKETNPNLVTITGEVSNPIGEAITFTGKDTTFSTTLNEKGIFEITFLLDSSIYLSFGHGPETTAMYVAPGDKIKLKIDTKQFDESISYEGSEASSFLANKFLRQEKNDFLGKEFYMKNSEEYKTFMQEYKTSITNELGNIKDSSFIKNEVSSIDRMINYYSAQQESLSEYKLDVRKYMMEINKMSQDFNFYNLIDSLNTEEFNKMLGDYSDKSNGFLAQVEDKDYIITAKEKIEKTITHWKERKIAKDNVPKEGEPAIDFTYPDKDGKEYSLSSFKGNLVYVDVWATWCGPCLGEVPSLQKLEKDYHGKNITFMSVSVDENKDAWLKMVVDKELGGVQIWADGWSKIAKDYAIFGIPRFMLFSAEGNVISTDAPRPSSKEIRELLDSNL